MKTISKITILVGTIAIAIQWINIIQGNKIELFVALFILTIPGYILAILNVRKKKRLS